jgi:hypothetical protein
VVPVPRTSIVGARRNLVRPVFGFVTQTQVPDVDTAGVPRAAIAVVKNVFLARVAVTDCPDGAGRKGALARVGRACAASIRAWEVDALVRGGVCSGRQKSLELALAPLCGALSRVGPVMAAGPFVTRVAPPRRRVGHRSMAGRTVRERDGALRLAHVDSYPVGHAPGRCQPSRGSCVRILPESPQVTGRSCAPGREMGRCR